MSSSTIHPDNVFTAEQAKTVGRSPQKLQLGAFNRPADGWINTDITPHIWIAKIPGAAWMIYKAGKMTHDRYEEHRRGIFRGLRYVDVTKPFPFPDASCEAVFSCHMLEHLYPWHAEHCLKEMYRVLKPRGICRIVVPDLDRQISRYSSEDPEPFLDDFFEQTSAMPKNAHHWHYNENSLRRKLFSIGFREVEHCTFRNGKCPDVEVLDNRPESLFMEAIK